MTDSLFGHFAQQYLAGLDEILTKLALAVDSETIRTVSSRTSVVCAPSRMQKTRQTCPVMAILTRHSVNLFLQATSTLNTQFYNTPNCIPALIEIVIKSPHWQVRQLASVELRKRISKWWPQLDASTQGTIRPKLLEIILQEQNDLVRHATARVISAVAKIDIPVGKWNDLMQFLYQCCNSANAGHREVSSVMRDGCTAYRFWDCVGIYVLYTLFEVVSNVFADNLHQLFALFGKALSDPESKIVRVTTL
ncbi:armadillo-type protein, partial [Jimgerdemannia flammicorona]